MSVRSIQTGRTFPLAGVKPLERIAGYREFCLSSTRKCLARSNRPRRISPITGKPLQRAGEVEGLPYSLCQETGSLFLAQVSDPEEWEALLAEARRYRHENEQLNGDLSHLRTDNVYVPKVDWIRETLALQGIQRPRILEAVIPPSELGPLLRGCHSFAEVDTVSEMELAHAVVSGIQATSEEAIVMLQSLDRVDDPRGLLRGAFARMREGGLLFVTALVASGFDLVVLGLRNLYLFPPDRTNCFSLGGLERLLGEVGFKLLEVSTPGVLDVEIVQAHLQVDPSLALSSFERKIVEAEAETRSDFQNFLQGRHLSSFARVVARKTA